MPRPGWQVLLFGSGLPDGKYCLRITDDRGGYIGALVGAAPNETLAVVKGGLLVLEIGGFSEGRYRLHMAPWPNPGRCVTKTVQFTVAAPRVAVG